MDTLAPWAEPVLMTAEELLRLPEDGSRYELVEGRLVRRSPTGGEHGLIAAELLIAIGIFVRERGLGRVFAAETGFWISPAGEPDTVLAPDLAFVRAGRELRFMRAGRELRFMREKYPRLAPDLVAEVVSPSQGHAEMGAKAQRWLSAGVRLVWIVLPQTRSVEVWQPDAPVRTLTIEDEISGENVLPGFALPAANLFA